MPYIPHTKDDVKAMLEAIGISSSEELFDEIPAFLRMKGLNKQIIPSGLTEMEIGREVTELASKDDRGLCFIGAGAYDHHIPAAVWEVTSRGEFLTAYTPYQPEASQGTLQLLYEYQTMMAGLMGLQVSNASLYDGASALAEAVLMAVRCQRKAAKKVLMPMSLHPHYRKVVQTIVRNQGIELVEIPYCKETGAIKVSDLTRFKEQDYAALIIPQPNFFGVLENVDELTDWAHQHGLLAIACVNPLAMALLKEPGQWGAEGADIACGEGQPFGVPLASGGPYFGFLCCKEEFVRQLPGRIVGRTLDVEGKQGFVLTLQAREQHIRRSKATSNICTNQGLLVTAATIYMSLLGPQGLHQVAAICHANTQSLMKKLTTIPGVQQVFKPPFFHEVVLRLTRPAKEVLQKLSRQGIQGGYSLVDDYPELGEAILVCATETKSEKDIQHYQAKLASCMEVSEKSFCGAL